MKLNNYTEIRTYEDACEKVGHLPIKDLRIENGRWSQYRNCTSDIAYMKLVTIAKALNDDPNFPTFHKDEERYYPRFVISRDEYGNAIDIEYIDYFIYANNCVPCSLYVKSAEIAEYFGSNFIHIWREFLIG